MRVGEAAAAVFVEVVDLAAARWGVAAGPDAVGAGGSGGGAGRSGETTGPPQIDDHPRRVDDDPAELAQQAGGGGFGWVDVVAVVGPAHEVVGVELRSAVSVHGGEHFLEGRR
nr:hypothetical protein [Candidatus Microthrix sp.]